MAVTPTQVNRIARSWQFQLCTWAGPVVAWYCLSGISSEAQYFRYVSSTCMLLPPPYRSVSRQFCFLASAREAVACCWLRYISRGLSLWPSLVVAWGLCPPRVGPIRMANFGDRVGLCPPCEASPAVLGVWPFELYLPGPIIMAKFGDRVGFRPPREASPAVLGVCTVELYLPGPIILATFGDRVGLCPPCEASPAVLGVSTVELGISPGAHPFGQV